MTCTTSNRLFILWVAASFITLTALAFLLVVVDATALSVQIEVEQRAEALLSAGLVDRAAVNDVLSKKGDTIRLTTDDPHSPLGYLDFQRRFLPLNSIGVLHTRILWVFAILGFQTILVILAAIGYRLRRSGC